MTPRERSETSLEALTTEIEAWKRAHPRESIHAVQPTRIIIRPELYQQARNLFARLAWQEWWRTARIFGFRSTAVRTFRSPV